MFFWFITAACQEEIDLEPPKTEPIVIIDAIITTAPSQSYVILSTTLPYNDDKPNPPIYDAIVEIENSENEHIVFKHTHNGRYLPPSNALFQEKERYRLTVTHNERIYSAESLMPNYVPLENGTINSLPEFPLFKQAQADFQDPKGTRNYYMWEIFADKKRINRTNILLYEDSEADGEKKLYSVIIPIPKSGSVISLNLLSITKKTFEYYTTLKEFTEENTSFQFGIENPSTNITGGALGFFTTASISSIDIIYE